MNEEQQEKKPLYNKNNGVYPWGGWTVNQNPPASSPDQDENGEEESGSGDDEDKDKDYGEGEDGNGGGYDDGRGSSGEPYETEARGEILTVKGGILQVFDSFDDLVNTADDRVKGRSKWRSRSSRERGRADWSGASSFDEALDQARGGWAKGMVKMNEVAEEFTRRSRWTVDKALSWDVAGAYPDVPLFLAGDPCNMINDGDMRNKVKPLIHIVVNKASHWGIGAKQIFNFGAALMVCMDQIEACGVRIQLDAVLPVSGGSKSLTTLVTIKKAHEHVEKNRVAYSMANSGLLRRLWFSLIEQFPELERDYSSGYGMPSEMEESLQPAGAVYIPSLQNFGGNAWDDINKSVKELQKFLGIGISQEGVVSVKKIKDSVE